MAPKTLGESKRGQQYQSIDPVRAHQGDRVQVADDAVLGDRQVFVECLTVRMTAVALRRRYARDSSVVMSRRASVCSTWSITRKPEEEASDVVRGNDKATR